MTRWLTCVLLALAATSGCGRPSPPAVNEEVSSQPAAVDSMVMRGIDLYMHRRDLGVGASIKPALWIRADSFTIAEGTIYSFEKARAVIYGKEDSEEIVVEAQRGSFEQDTSAALEGDVRLTAGTLSMLLRDISWAPPGENSDGAAHTENPVVIDDPDLQLNAAAMRLHPDSRTFELTRASGVVRFGKEFP